MTVTAPGSWRSLDVRPRYTEQHVERLLPMAVWGVGSIRPLEEQRVEGDGRASDLPAMLADMQAAWRLAPMRRPVRQALFLHLACDMRQDQAALLLNISRPSVSLYYRAGVAAMLAFLNGDLA